MLHSSLPRAFLAPALNYLGYYGEEMHHPYGTASAWHIPVEHEATASTYNRVPEHVPPARPPASATSTLVHYEMPLHRWQRSRSSSPSPLDLSLKAPPPPPPPPPTPSTPRSEDAIEVDDEEDRRIREEAHKRTESRRYRLVAEHTENSPSTERWDVVPSVRSPHPSYAALLDKENLSLRHSQDLLDKCRFAEEGTRLPPAAYPTDDAIEKSNHLHRRNEKLLLGSPTHNYRTMQSYHQQLLLTPQHHLQSVHAPMTPPSTPSPPQCPRRRTREDEVDSPVASLLNSSLATPTLAPSANNTCNSNCGAGEKLSQRAKKKHARRLKFDEDTSSPVSGTVILAPDEALVTGDIDPAFNIVEVTEEARAELAKIENRLGPYQCKLCRQLHEDAFQLAQHRCSRIAHVEYRCPECDKRFSCPANLASHRRWHKPRLSTVADGNSAPSTSSSAPAEICCAKCDAKFTRQSALRKHVLAQHPDKPGNARNDSLEDAPHVGESRNASDEGGGKVVAARPSTEMA